LQIKAVWYFCLNVPFEFRNYIKPGSNCDIKLPENKIIKGTIGETLPGIEPWRKPLSISSNLWKS